MNERLQKLVEVIQLNNSPGEFASDDDLYNYLASLILFGWKSGEIMTIRAHMSLCDLFEVAGAPPHERGKCMKIVSDLDLVLRSFRRENEERNL